MKSSIIILKEDFCEEWLPVLKNAGVKTLGLHFVVTENTLEDFLRWVKTARPLIEKFESEGIEIEYEVHAVGQLLTKTHFDAHPEYYRMDETGNRNPDYNLCPSNKEALELLSNAAFEMAKFLKQKGHRYHIWMDDKELFCACEDCKKLTLADQNLLCMQAVLSGLKRYDKDAKLCYLAYGAIFDPPTLPIPKDIFLEFAPMNRDLSMPITKEADKKVRADLDRLLQVFDPADAEVLEYFLDESLFSGYNRNNVKAIDFRPEITRQDLEYYKSKGVGWVKTFGAYIDKSYFEKYSSDVVVSYGKLFEKL